MSTPKLSIKRTGYILIPAQHSKMLSKVVGSVHMTLVSDGKYPWRPERTTHFPVHLTLATSSIRTVYVHLHLLRVEWRLSKIFIVQYVRNNWSLKNDVINCEGWLSAIGYRWHWLRPFSSMVLKLFAKDLKLRLELTSHNDGIELHFKFSDVEEVGGM